MNATNEKVMTWDIWFTDTEEGTEDNDGVFTGTEKEAKEHLKKIGKGARVYREEFYGEVTLTLKRKGDTERVELKTRGECEE